jgi:hypothetical protein
MIKIVFLKLWNELEAPKRKAVSLKYLQQNIEKKPFRLT